jgi:hypothetical protein
MFEKVSQAAEQVATSFSRRRFLGNVARGALGLAGAVAGILAWPSDAHAGGKFCCCGGRCFQGNLCGKGCYRVRACSYCL